MAQYPRNHNADAGRVWVFDAYRQRIRASIGHFVSVVLYRYRTDLLSLQAMGLTYTTLLSLVPFLAVTFAVLTGFGIQYRIEPLLAEALEPLGPKGQEITNHIIQFVDNIRVGVLGAIGVAAFFYTVISLVSKIEDALNRIWRVRQARSWGRRFRDYLSIVLIGPVLVFTAIAFTASAQSHHFVQYVMQTPAGDLVLLAATRIMPFLILCATFTVVYIFVTNTTVRLSSALLGGAVAAGLWLGAGIWFSAFVAGSARYAAVYSSFAILVLFFIWLYLSWLIILVGAEVAYFHQYPNAYVQEPLLDRYPRALEEQLGLSVLTAITRRYLAGQPPYSIAALAGKLKVSPASLEEPINSFVGTGLLLRTTEPAALTLGRPPEGVLMADVIAMLQGLLPSAPLTRQDSAVAGLLAQRDQGVRDALEGVTLRAVALGGSQAADPGADADAADER